MDCDEDINFAKLSKELSIAMREDEKYQRENAAKFRAVEQRVGSYEEFRDIVLASHLKPLDRESISCTDNNVQQPWNRSVLSNKGGVNTIYGDLSVSGEERTTSNTKTMDGSPTTLVEFNRLWKKCTDTNSRYKFLVGLENNTVEKLYKADAGSAPLEGIVHALNVSFDSADADSVMRILAELCNCSRIDIAIMFLGKGERGDLQNLFKKLEKCVDVDRLLRLRETLKS